MAEADADAVGLVGRIVEAVNTHDLEALVDCFREDYRNDTPAHPARSFVGREQVRRNWSQIFAALPDIRARVPRSVVDGNVLWTEWDLSGSRRDGTSACLRGVVIFAVEAGRASSATFYLEPVEHSSGDVDAAVGRVAAGSPQEAS